ncbi:MAG: TIGR02530 family flagellar biosynthesis protein [bacterium]|nr:TIGR02530 family flagellar biosynthesis protein [bacterium]
MNISSNKFNSIELMREQLRKNTNQLEKQNDQLDRASFKSILENTKILTDSSGLKFSKHANERLASRNIDLTKEQLEKLEEGTNKAKSKGINESLVVVDGLSFIVSCKNNTVITAVDDESEQVFTNIDGAVIM